nr:recombinase family protein [uncultured Noviherbaspirillum sp.]
MACPFVNAVAEFERDLLIERTNSGIRRARAKGKKFGCCSTLIEVQKNEVLRQLAQGTTIAQVARQVDATRRQSCGSAQSKSFRISPSLFTP